MLTTLIGVVAGTLGAAARERRRDAGSLSFFLALDAMPPFWVGMLLILAFGVHLKVLPIFGAVPAGRDVSGLAWIVEVARHAALPTATLVIAGVGQTYLVVRYSMLSVLGREYMLMARAKGLPAGRLLFRHAFRNAVLPRGGADPPWLRRPCRAPNPSRNDRRGDLRALPRRRGLLAAGAPAVGVDRCRHGSRAGDWRGSCWISSPRLPRAGAPARS